MHGLSMGYYSAKILHDDAEMKTFLDIEVVEVLPFEGDRSMHGLFQDFWISISYQTTSSICDFLTSAVLNLLRVACEGEFSVLIKPVKLLCLGTEVFDNISECSRRYRPVIF